ncbi:MAG: hypothetical protein HYR94_04545 [Chloroflexi bacterium]|nr:hypothetical protein [Chloroflexota bacterium]
MKWEYLYFQIYEDNTGQYQYMVEGPDNVSLSEYDFFAGTNTLRQDIISLLNQMGVDGWEVIQINDDFDTSVGRFQVWLKRQVVGA